MNSTLNKIKEVYAEFLTDAEKSEEGNKAAGVRARKAMMELRTLFAEFKKESLGKS